MNLPSFLYTTLSVLAILGFIARIVVWPLVRTYMQTKITAGIDEAVKKRLAAFQFDLDKQMEVHRNALSIAGEHIRSSLARDTADFAIYAQRRHDAVSNLFADFLRAEGMATDFRDLRKRGDPTDGSVPKEDMASQVIKARDAANEAYFRSALYLPDKLDLTAKQVVYEFHNLLVEHVAPGESPRLAQGQAERKLRFELLELQRLSREELARARPLPHRDLPTAETTGS